MPLVSEKYKHQYCDKDEELTGDVRRCPENCSHLWIQLDAVVGDQLGVPLLLLLVHPVLESVTALREEHVNDVL